MRKRNLSRFATLAVASGLVFSSFQASPEDIDIFSVDESNIVARPNVLFVLDNSANWSRASQKWPGGEDQGQSEATAIKTVINELDESINVGLMEYITGGSSGDTDSAMIRFHIRPMTAANKLTLSNHLDTIYNNINSPDEKRSQSNPFGNLFWDVYNYLGGLDHSNLGSGTLASKADGSAYSNLYKTFNSPLTSADTCTRTVVVFIANNIATDPRTDSTANVDALKALAEDANGSGGGDAAVVQIPFADYVVTTTASTDNLGFSSACYSSQAACTTALAARDADSSGAADCGEDGYLSCSCSSTSVACPNSHWSVVGSNTVTANTVLTGPTSTVQANQSTGDIVQTCKNASQGAALNPTGCPASTDVTQANTPVAGQSTRTQTSWASCSYVDIGSGTCSPATKHNYEKQGTKTTTVTVSQVTSITTPTPLGDSAACFNDATSCNAVSGGFACPAGTYNNGCTCTAATTTTGCSAGGTSKFMETGTYNIIAATQTGTFSASPAGPWMVDEWAKFLRQTGVLIPGGTVRSQVTTYTVDVFNAQQNATQSALLFNAARVGGGKYFQAKDKNALINALRQILTEVQAVNSAFSSASLPVNATNRAQNENQVFIGVFKPDRQKRPDWFGNLKRYQLVSTGAVVELGDAKGNPAVNEQTGFITECAESFWTTDSIFDGTGYWKTPISTDPIPESDCATAADVYSDLPDGPFVEKGAVAEVIRKGNDATATADTDGNYVLNRTIYTRTAATTSGSTPPAFNTTNSGLSSALVNFISGQDVLDEDLDEPATRARTEPRSTVHGDVVHSRPQPLNFGGTTGVVVFYGSNDGHYRAVKALTGQELWAFVAPEHYTKLQRLFDNAPNVKYFGDLAAGSQAKDYFFDGSTGVYQTFNADATTNTAYVYPTMRRGGYKVYALDVTSPSAPKYRWSKGCSSTHASCDTGFSAIGQTWSLPNVALVKGYCGSGGCIDDTTPRLPVVVFGGGYDTCDDEDTSTPCSATLGRGVYVVDGTTGALLKYFDFSGITGSRGVAADVALIDVDNDDMVDYGYAVDTGGNVYRMDFIDGPATKVALDETEWISSRVAFTNNADDPRKFLFAPALVQATSSVVYLALGTGDREHPLRTHYAYGDEGDAASAILNRFYVFKDPLTDVDSATETDLDDTSTMADYTDSNSCSNAPITPTSSLNGWFIDLDEQGQGEQGVTSAVIAAGFVFFSTNRPTPPDTEACSSSLGEARGYFLNLLNGSGAIGVSGACGGTRSSTFVGGGLPPSPVLATVPIDGELRTVVIGAVQKTGEPSSPIEAQRVRPPIASDRKPIYWYKSTGDK
ncbi:MAG: pilus assembly protein [Nevskiaceae bacterium]